MSREFHEKIAAALDALSEAADRRPAQITQAPQQKPVAAKPATKTASAAPVRDRYTKLTGEDLPDEVAESPAAVEALRKVAMAAGPVNELGEPSDRFDRSGSRPVGRTKAERVKEAYALFGDDLLKY